MYSMGIIDGPHGEHVKWIKSFPTYKEARDAAKMKCEKSGARVCLFQKYSEFSPVVMGEEDMIVQPDLREIEIDE